MDKLIIGLLVAAFGGYIVYRNSRRNRHAEASIKFHNKIHSILEGLYPIPTNWPQDINKHLRGIFPKLQIAVAEFRPFVPFYSKRFFDNAWRLYRLGKNGREIDEQYYGQYIPGSGVSVIKGKEVRNDNTKTYKETFKKNVDRLLKYAKQK